MSNPANRPRTGTERSPNSFDEYPNWLKKKFGFQIRESRAEYEALASLLHSTFSDSPLWDNLKTRLQELHDRYRIKTGFDLFYTITMPKIYRKPWDSFLNKTYRLNFLKDMGAGEKKAPYEMYEQVDDVVRTCFVVKYLDGVEFLVSQLKSKADALQLDNRIEIKANDAGY